MDAGRVGQIEAAAREKKEVFNISQYKPSGSRTSEDVQGSAAKAREVLGAGARKEDKSDEAADGWPATKISGTLSLLHPINHI